MPFEVADYVDFYASLDHATNVGKIFRPDDAGLPPPGGTCRSATTAGPGRSSSRAPTCAARRASGAARMGRTFGPSQRLDIEAELGFVVGTAVALSARRCRPPAFASHVFGVVGLNDWSARDIQAWEYVPLGPFLGKSFATSVSAWVTPLAALDAARVDLPVQDPAPLGYLAVEQPAGFDLAVEVVLGGEDDRATAVRLDVLGTGPDARPPDRQRRLVAHRRPVRLRHHQRPRARPARVAARAVLGRPASRSPPAAASAPSSRTATRSPSATPRPAPAATSPSARSPAASSADAGAACNAGLWTDSKGPRPSPGVHEPVTDRGQELCPHSGGPRRIPRVGAGPQDDAASATDARGMSPALRAVAAGPGRRVHPSAGRGRRLLGARDQDPHRRAWRLDRRPSRRLCRTRAVGPGRRRTPLRADRAGSRPGHDRRPAGLPHVRRTPARHANPAAVARARPPHPTGVLGGRVEGGVKHHKGWVDDDDVVVGDLYLTQPCAHGDGHRSRARVRGRCRSLPTPPCASAPSRTSSAGARTDVELARRDAGSRCCRSRRRRGTDDR